jgi:hypothetical protein
MFLKNGIKTLFYTERQRDLMENKITPLLQIRGDFNEGVLL